MLTIFPTVSLYRFLYNYPCTALVTLIITHITYIFGLVTLSMFNTCCGVCYRKTLFPTLSFVEGKAKLYYSKFISLSCKIKTTLP